MTAPAETVTKALPSAWAIGLSRGALELKSFFRERQSVVFTFAMPVMLLLIFGTVFKGEVGTTGVDFRQYFAAGIISSGIVSTTFVSLGIGIGIERDDGTLKRLYGTPMPRGVLPGQVHHGVRARPAGSGGAVHSAVCCSAWSRRGFGKLGVSDRTAAVTSALKRRILHHDQ
jgi:hypothetical protein